MNARDHLLWLIDVFDDGRIEPETFASEFARTWKHDLDPRDLSADVWAELSNVFYAVCWFEPHAAGTGTGEHLDVRGLRRAVHAARRRLPASGPLERPESSEVPRLEMLLRTRSSTEVKALGGGRR